MAYTFAPLHDLSTTVILHKTLITFSAACWPSTLVSSAPHLQPSTAGAVPHAPLTPVRLWKRSRPKFTHWSPREAETGYSRHKVRTGKKSHLIPSACARALAKRLGARRLLTEQQGQLHVRKAKTAASAPFSRTRPEPASKPRLLSRSSLTADANVVAPWPLTLATMCPREP